MGGGGKAPKANPVVVPEDPDANEQAKSAAAEAKSRERRRAGRGTINNTLATSPEGTLGAAPTSQPTLKSNLG